MLEFVYYPKIKWLHLNIISNFNKKKLKVKFIKNSING